ncbi:MAG: pyrrolysine--tRNA(Pyl) ligase large subunit [Bacillota bacterium]|jgi:phenylalanyl-tRNA synthetase alpha chain|nr:pyrrolysine--tRNA(Pyl) ligase large subunit [Bacillota bacterium]
MAEKFTTTQTRRLVELNGEPELFLKEFETAETRNRFFKETENRLVKLNREKLRKLLNEEHKPLSVRIEEQLKAWLTAQEGFTQVVTPTIITAEMLDKMTITKEHPLTNQVFWLDTKRCLRPMLAPNLYEVMRDLHKVTKEPVRIFEAGSCYRKESQGAQHMNEFTMLNLVEFAGTEEGAQMKRLKELAEAAMKAIGMEHYELVIEKSEVYGETMDIVADGLELASGAYGPHFLDGKWGVFEPWVGIGFGIERIAMKTGGYQTIKRVGKSIAFLDGSPLKI